MSFREMFAEEIEKVNKKIDEILPRKPEVVYGMLKEYIFRGGKRVRPVLLLTFTKLYGGSVEEALLPAALIEIFHNFTLIHDDIEDGSKLRRGKPTLHEMYGVPIAINSGDALYTFVWSKIAEMENVELRKIFARAFTKVVEGQGWDIYWVSKEIFEIGEEDYLNMVRGKTAALIAASCELGVVMAGKGKEERKWAREFGENLGLAFQIRDDVLNLIGEEEKYKKEIGGDITEGKRTLMVIKTLERAEEKDKRRLIEILKRHTTDKGEIKEAIEIMKKYGGISYAMEKAMEYAKKAKSLLERFPEGEEKEKLNKIAEYFTKRVE